MKISCPRKALYDSIQTVQRAVSSRSSLPILSHIVMTAQDGGLTLMATDLEMWVSRAAQADVEETGSVTVPARVISEVLASLPDEDVTILQKEGGRVALECGASSYELLGLEPGDFPKPPEVESEASFTIKAQDLRLLIDRTLFAVSQDTSRVTLTGVLLVLEDSALKAVSTDTHRLCLSAVDVSEPTGAMQHIVPERAMGEVHRLAGELDPEAAVTIRASSTQVLFECGESRLTSRLIEGQFPNYEKVIPTDYDKKLIIPTEQFRQAVKRAAIVARDDANRITFETYGGTLKLSAESPNIGIAKEEVDVVREGDDIRMAFNSKYLLDFLSITNTEAIEMELTGELSPALIRPQGVYDYTYILMPMQVRSYTTAT